jgi:hypothetical protein
MKKLALATLALTCAASVFAQGTVVFGNRFGNSSSYVYKPLAPGSSAHQIGNGTGTADVPTGTTDWTGYVKVGTTAAEAASYFCTLLSANGSGVNETNLSQSTSTTTFRSGGAAGNLPANLTATLGNVAKDSPFATLEMVAWDNSTGLYSTWAQASIAWSAGLIAAGRSNPINLAAIGGDFNTPPNTVGFQSFNLYYAIPEPTSFALAGLGAAAMLIFRRRKQ